MAEINAAWRALSDPSRRAMYDASLRPPSAAPFTPRPAASRLEEERYPVSVRGEPHEARFPFGAFAAVVVVAMVLMFIASGIASREDGSDPVDPIMRQGDCVVIEENNDARKVGCDEDHFGVVTAFVPFGGDCPIGTAPHRDRQGMGIACVSPAGG